jgi:hypothetical protein
MPVKTKKPRQVRRGLSHIHFDLIDFAMRSSSFRNSAVSSSFGLEGGLRKGITSDIGRSLGTSALYPLLPHNYCIYAAMLCGFWTRHKKVRPRNAPRPDLTGARGTSARAAMSIHIGTTTAFKRRSRAGGLMTDEFLFGEKLQRAVPFEVDGISEVAVDCWKHGDHRAALVVVGRIIDLLANRKLRHREILLELSKPEAIIRTNWLTLR